MPTQSQLLPITYAHYCSTVMLWLSACLLSLPPTLPPHSFCFILPQALILKSFYKKTHHVLEGYGQSGFLCVSLLCIYPSCGLKCVPRSSLPLELVLILQDSSTPSSTLNVTFLVVLPGTFQSWEQDSLFPLSQRTWHTIHISCWWNDWFSTWDALIALFSSSFPLNSGHMLPLIGISLYFYRISGK